ncbi:DUF1707 domain-containing protein [Corynebacterium kutscheri]|uniref:DUF1707 domain-containing protein n=2 Tax=Corynebacterium kutscheri TaxID=35755 RepID=A0A0F6R362_9CORY|nr:DUF1707 domain-containing protein [Corynebacterium kutscheri]AKE42063.1 protein of unknown function (DUF1707) [Corynebacterium kutscheri]
MSDPFNPDYRISDEERHRAMQDLGAHFAAGRLDSETYDARLTQVAQATMKSEISPLFDDLPANTAIAASHDRFYTAAEIDKAAQRGGNIRHGIMGLSIVAAIAGTYAYPIMIILIPTVFILLYVMKLGPESWYKPSARQLERERMREVRLEQMRHKQAIQMSIAQQQAEQKALRQQKIQEINSLAMDLTSDALKRFQNRR